MKYTRICNAPGCQSRQNPMGSGYCEEHPAPLLDARATETNAAPYEDGRLSIIDTREKTHGNFKERSWHSQQMKNYWRRYPGDLHEHELEALDAIAEKISRILNGDPHHADHWRGIAGYATLVARINEKGGE